MLVIIQARLSSKRLPNKVLKKIGNLTIIEHIIRNIRKSKKIKKIVVSISKNRSDDRLCKFLKNKRINYFRGDLHNVADRLLKTAIKYRSRYFIRVSADSPLIDHKVIDELIKKYNNIKKHDIYTNVFPRTYPKGKSVEIIKTSILKKFIKFMEKDDQEHVTKFFYRNYKKFKIKNLRLRKKSANSSINLSVDTKADLNRISRIIKNEN